MLLGQIGSIVCGGKRHLRVRIGPERTLGWRRGRPSGGLRSGSAREAEADEPGQAERRTRALRESQQAPSPWGGGLGETGMGEHGLTVPESSCHAVYRDVCQCCAQFVPHML